MTRIKLIVTGALEKAALKQSLEPLFPGVYFGVSTVQAGFISNQLKTPYAPPASKSLTSIEKLFAEALASAEPREPDNYPFDYAVIIDDLELPNLRQANVAVDFAKQALGRYLQQLASRPAQPTVTPKGKLKGTTPPPNTPQARQSFFQNRCSLHFLTPMAEAVFFGDPPSLQRAKIQVASSFDPALCDLEDFAVAHAGYPGWNIPSNQTWYQPWMQNKHPKDYLTFLCGNSYREVEQGKAALEALDWRSVLQHQAYTQFARALIEDIAQMTRTKLPWLIGTSHTLTAYKTQSNRTLRNL